MEAIQSIAVIINPVSGSGTGARIAAELAKEFKARFEGYDLTFIETRSKEHAIELGATQRADLLIMVSGDGTAHDLVQGIMSRPRDVRPAFSIIPIGSGNDYARTLGIVPNALEAVRALAEGVRVSSDVGLCNDVYYLETLSFGIDAAIAAQTIVLRRTTKAQGVVLYAHAAVLAILKDLKSHHARLTMNGRTYEDDFLICAVQNGPTYGGGFCVSPHARITDGKLNVCFATKVATLPALYYLTRLFRGTHEKLKVFSTAEVERMTIDFDEPVPAQWDGEPQMGSHFEVEILPGALDVIVPKDSPVLRG
ncbi:MAG: diacylglycerol kinase family lipid kinase [Coriobacteriales bacterium]|jgi:YegS/Rv2252/BmrU family lipid kinase|nr:diacylglycerol kinase family lipid kinase [Coriobacteriales bacterium]